MYIFFVQTIPHKHRRGKKAACLLEACNVPKRVKAIIIIIHETFEVLIHGFQEEHWSQFCWTVVR